MSKKKDKNDIKKVDDVEKVESSEPENSELIECKKRVEELESIAKRALADYQNLEKRVREEKRGWILSTNRQLILRLLPVLDILVMASQHVDNQGLQLSIKQIG